MANISQLNELSPTIQERIKRIIQEEGYTEHAIEVRKVSPEGGSYQGVLYEIDVKGKINDQEKETNLFLKHVISNHENFKLYPVTEVYRREAFIYNELSKVFTELEDEAYIPISSRLNIVKGYECDTEAIILENIAMKGFGTHTRMDVMPLELAELAVKQLARFHALSFVLKIKRPEYFTANITTIKQSMVFDDVYRDFVKKMFDISFNQLDDDRKEKLANFFPVLEEDFPKFVRGEMTEVKCLCHGDYRISNIMRKEEDGIVTEVIPIDYQQMYYGSPILDFIYLVFGASDSTFRKNNLNYLKYLYFEKLGIFLMHFKIDISTVYPKEEFEKDYKTCLKYGLLFSLYFMPFFFVAEDDTPNLDDELMGLSLNLDQRFKDRLQDIIDDFVEWEYL